MAYLAVTTELVLVPENVVKVPDIGSERIRMGKTYLVKELSILTVATVLSKPANKCF